MVNIRISPEHLPHSHRAMEIVRHPDAAAFLHRAEVWLRQAEAENNLMLGIARALISGDHPYRDPIYLATVEDDGKVCGCAFRTPPYKFALTRMPPAAIDALVDSVASLYPSIHAVGGPEPAATRFARAWASRQGIETEVSMRNGIYALDTVVRPSSPPAGSIRQASGADLARLSQWGHLFVEETGIEHPDPAGLAVRLLEQGSMYVWEDDSVTSMAAAMDPTPTGVRIGYVYTPPEARGRGYASILVAELSQLYLDRGRSLCFLYTDMANPTSNAIYQRIGYRQVCEVVDIAFRQRAISHWC